MTKNGEKKFFKWKGPYSRDVWLHRTFAKSMLETWNQRGSLVKYMGEKIVLVPYLYLSPFNRGNEMKTLNVFFSKLGFWSKALFIWKCSVYITWFQQWLNSYVDAPSFKVIPDTFECFSWIKKFWDYSATWILKWTKL